MLILAARTDKPEAEIYLLENGEELARIVWLAHRELSDTLHLKIKELLDSQNKKLDDLAGLIVFRGPGSFTGLRIGITVMNTFAYSLNIPVVGVLGKNWIKDGVRVLLGGGNDKIVLPEYGAEPNITTPKK